MRILTFLFWFLVGFGLLLIGCVYIISYLNLLTFGYNFIDYVKYIIVKPECLIAPIGLVIITLSIMLLGGKNNELYL